MMQLRRSLGLTDVVLFFVITCTNLQWVATAAAAGPSSLPIWFIGCAAMFIPLSIAVMHLSSLYPEEGGMYVWSRRAFGPFGGFMTGWSYWSSNLPYFPALLYFTAGNAMFIGGETPHGLAGSPLYFMAFSLIAFAVGTLLNIFGLDVGKWLNNVGAASRWMVTLILIALGVAAWRHFGPATLINASTMQPGFHLKDLVFWSVIAFAWTGPEAVPFMAGEIKDARRTIPHGLAIAAPGIAAIYVLGTVSVLVALPAAHVSALYGVMQSISAVAARLNLVVLTPIAAILVTLSCLGSVGAWLGAVARIPFVAGIDKYLPESFGRMHPRWASPVTALLTQAGIALIFIVIGQGGTTVKGAYDVLVSSTVLSTMIPFLLLFASALKLPGGKPLVWVSALVGLCTTITSIGLAMVPAQDEQNKPLAVAKVLGLTAFIIGSGVIAYYFGRKRAAAEFARNSKEID